MSGYNYFEKAPKLADAFAGQNFDANKSVQGINLQQEAIFSTGAAESAAKELSQANEYRQQMRERALADGGGPETTAGRKLASTLMGEALMYGASVVNPALAPLAILNTMKTVNSIRSGIEKSQFATNPEDIGKGSSKKDVAEESAYESDGLGSQSSFQAAAAQMAAQESSFASMGMLMNPYHEVDKPKISHGVYHNSQHYDNMYAELKESGLDANDIYMMAENMDRMPEMQELMAQYQRHSVERSNNLDMVGRAQMVGSGHVNPSSPAPGLA